MKKVVILLFLILLSCKRVPIEDVDSFATEFAEKLNATNVETFEDGDHIISAMEYANEEIALFINPLDGTIEGIYCGQFAPRNETELICNIALD